MSIPSSSMWHIVICRKDVEHLIKQVELTKFFFLYIYFSLKCQLSLKKLNNRNTNLGWNTQHESLHLYEMHKKGRKKKLKLLVFSTYILTFLHTFKYTGVTLRPFLFRVIREGFFNSQFKLCNPTKELHIIPVNIAKPCKVLKCVLHFCKSF